MGRCFGAPSDSSQRRSLSRSCLVPPRSSVSDTKINAGYRRTPFGHFIKFIAGNPVMPVVTIAAVVFFVMSVFSYFGAEQQRRRILRRQRTRTGHRLCPRPRQPEPCRKRRAGRLRSKTSSFERQRHRQRLCLCRCGRPQRQHRRCGGSERHHRAGSDRT